MAIWATCAFVRVRFQDVSGESAKLPPWLACGLPVSGESGFPKLAGWLLDVFKAADKDMDMAVSSLEDAAFALRCASKHITCTPAQHRRSKLVHVFKLFDV